ncbi:hypothetical protein CsSME_00028306 [Camellia sinensis var. sinensis]
MLSCSEEPITRHVTIWGQPSKHSDRDMIDAQGQQSSCFSHARHKVRGDPDVLVVVAVAAAAAVVVERTW